MRIPLSFIKSERWYRQGGAGRLLYFSYAAEACSGFAYSKRSLPFFYPILFFFQNDYANILIGRSAIPRIARWYIRRQKENPSFIVNEWEWWRRNCALPLESHALSLTGERLRECSNENLARWYRHFSRAYIFGWRRATANAKYQKTFYAIAKIA